MKISILHSLLIAGAVIALGACGPSNGVNETATAPEGAPEGSTEEPSIEAPASPDGQPSPDSPTSGETASLDSSDIDSETIDQFVNVINRIQAIQEESEAQSMAAFEEQGLSQDTFNQIIQAQQDPTSAESLQITPEDQEKIQQAAPRIMEIQEEADRQIGVAIQEEGFNEERFNQVAMVIQQDPELIQEVQSRMMAN